MYGFKNTKCKIKDCPFPVWPNRTLGLCSRHYHRYKRGRMAENGELLPLPVKTKVCEACGKVFILKERERNVRWCQSCRIEEYSQIQIDNIRGIYRRDIRRNKALKRKYIVMILNKTIKACEFKKRHQHLLDMRKSGLTYPEIALKVGLSKQRIQQICSRYS